MLSALKTLHGFASVPFSPSEWFQHFKLGLQCLWPITKEKANAALMLLAQVLNLAALIPILTEVVTTHRPSGTPLVTLAMFAIIQSIFARAGFLNRDWFMAFGMVISALMMSATIILSIIYA